MTYTLENLESTDTKKKIHILGRCIGVFCVLCVVYVITLPTVDNAFHFIHPNGSSVLNNTNVTNKEWEDRDYVRNLRDFKNVMQKTCTKIPYAVLFAHDFVQGGQKLNKNVFYICDLNEMYINAYIIPNNDTKMGGACHEKYGNRSSHKIRGDNITVYYSTIQHNRPKHVQTRTPTEPSDKCIIQHALSVVNGEWA